MADIDQGATPDVPAVDAPVITQEEPKSMDDTIRETLHELESRGADASTASEAPATPEEKAQRIRDAQGKFTVKEAGADAPVVDAQAAGGIAAPEAEQVSVAPNTWKKEVAEKWPALPPEVRAEVERREADFHKGIEQYREAANFGSTMERAIAPYVARIQSLGLSPDRAVAALFSADQRLSSGDPSALVDLAKQYNYNPTQMAELFSGQPAQQNIDPNVSALKTQVDQLTGYIQNQQLSTQQQQEAALNSEIAKFQADPTHSHFDVVRPHMIALLQAGQANDLQDAYEQAVYANPTTRAAMLEQYATQQREEATKKAQAAKTAASVNVRSRPSMPVSQPIGSMDDTIRATLRKLQGA